MNYIQTPLVLKASETSVTISRNLKDLKSMIDNLIETIIFTPKGSFLADLDFGFEYWNHEYTNINYKKFNSGQAITASDGSKREITKDECLESIRNSLTAYAPQLFDFNINMELLPTFEGVFNNEEIKSRHSAKIIVDGFIENGLGTSVKYQKEVVFFTEPTIKKRR